MRKKRSYLVVTVIILINLVWYLVFRGNLLNFWFRLLIAIVVLNLVVSNYQDYNFEFDVNTIFSGVISAIILYFIFLAGKYGSELLFSSGQQQITSVYQLGKNTDYAVIILVLVVAGIGEELLWRGFLQQNLTQLFSAKLGYIITSLIYAGVHIWTGNLILVLAALTAGLFWGYLYWKNKSLTQVIISHVLWDLLVFALFPLDF
ncbi:MAG: CPBP family intramembrane glutamic endopeptidase [Bacillota bacterium]